MRTLILALLLLVPLSVSAQDFISSDQVWGVNAAGDTQFWQDWTDHKLQMASEIAVPTSTQTELDKKVNTTDIIDTDVDNATLTITGTNPQIISVNDSGIGPTQLANTTVTPGDYTNTNLSIDADGRVTAASNGSSSGGGDVALIANGTAALGTSAIADGACATAVASSGAGIATTDVITWSFNQDVSGVTGYNPTGDLVYIMAYPTSGNANFKVCNKSGSSVTPGAITLNWRVVR